MTGQDIIKRFDCMNDDVIHNWKNMWQECADWAMPENNNINQVRVQGLEKSPQRMTDACIEANINFASGFFSHMFPPSTIWATLKHPSPAMMQNENVQRYFEEVSRIIHRVMVGSNFAQEEYQELLCMGAFGTNCLSIEEDDKNVVRFRNFVVDKIRIAENYLGEVDTVAREFSLTPRQAIQQFGKEDLLNAGLEKLIFDAAENKKTIYQFVHYVSPREDFDSEKMDKLNKPYASIYVCREGEEIVKEGGFDYNPYKVARFVQGNDEVYGRSPMTMKLACARRTNVIYRTMIVSAERHAGEQWLVPDDDSVSGISHRANAIIKFRQSSGEPKRLQPNGDPGIALEMYQMHVDEINRAFFNHLFRSLDDRQNMTAFEANERVNADMMSISPFVSRYTDEKVSPIIETVYYICQKRGVLPELPQELVDSPEFEIDYVGKLAQATKSFETLGAFNTISMFGELGQMSPKMLRALDNVDEDKLFVDAWYSETSGMNALRDANKVKDMRAEQAEAQAKQQQVENMPAMADAAQKLSGAVDPNSIISQMGETQ